MLTILSHLHWVNFSCFLIIYRFIYKEVYDAYFDSMIFLGFLKVGGNLTWFTRDFLWVSLKFIWRMFVEHSPRVEANRWSFLFYLVPYILLISWFIVFIPPSTILFIVFHNIFHIIFTYYIISLGCLNKSFYMALFFIFMYNRTFLL